MNTFSCFMLFSYDNISYVKHFTVQVKLTLGFMYFVVSRHIQ